MERALLEWGWGEAGKVSQAKLGERAQRGHLGIWCCGRH